MVDNTEEIIKYNNFTSGLAYNKDNRVVYLINTKAYDLKEDYETFKLSKKINNIDEEITLEADYTIEYVNVYIEPVDNIGRNIFIEFLDKPEEGSYEVRVYKLKYLDK